MSACALFFLIQLSVQEGGSSSSWNYALSGANWRDKDCVNGKRQSPIDIPLFNDTKLDKFLENSDIDRDLNKTTSNVTQVVRADIMDYNLEYVPR